MNKTPNRRRIPASLALGVLALFLAGGIALVLLMSQGPGNRTTPLVITPAPADPPVVPPAPPVRPRTVTSRPVGPATSQSAGAAFRITRQRADHVFICGGLQLRIGEDNARMDVIQMMPMAWTDLRDDQRIVMAYERLVPRGTIKLSDEQRKTLAAEPNPMFGVRLTPEIPPLADRYRAAAEADRAAIATDLLKILRPLDEQKKAAYGRWIVRRRALLEHTLTPEQLEAVRQQAQETDRASATQPAASAPAPDGVYVLDQWSVSLTPMSATFHRQFDGKFKPNFVIGWPRVGGAEADLINNIEWWVRTHSANSRPKVGNLTDEQWTKLVALPDTFMMTPTQEDQEAITAAFATWHAAAPGDKTPADLRLEELMRQVYQRTQAEWQRRKDLQVKFAQTELTEEQRKALNVHVALMPK